MGQLLLHDLVAFGKKQSASDLHLEAGSPAIFRIRGELSKKGEVLKSSSLLEAAQELLGQDAWKDFLKQKSTDFSKTIAGSRCRINIFVSLKGISFSIRLLTMFKHSLRDCNLHPELKNVLKHEAGLVILSGPTGSGKSTTLSALIEELNARTRSNILTIEKPIEYPFQNQHSMIRQREVPTHTPSFEQAIQDSLREDPDVLVIGEMREPEVMRLTLNAAETGHLVLASMHSASCTEAISRLCMSFPSDIQPAIRSQIADCLIAVICQRLVFVKEFNIQVPILEIMTSNTSVKSNIRSGIFTHLQSSIQTGADDGMYTFERYRKWMEQKSDWVLPGQASKGIQQSQTIIPETNLELTKPNAHVLPRTFTSASTSKTPKPLSDRHEIQIEHIDLAALAKQLE